MSKAPCCSKVGLNRGPWSTKEDMLLTNYVQMHGEGRWRALPTKAGLLRCGKSCRLRWMNYLRPDIKRGNISSDEEDLIIRLHKLLGNRWSLIAGRLPGRTDNEIKNYWNTHLCKKLKKSGTQVKDSKISKKGKNEYKKKKQKDHKIENGKSKCSDDTKRVQVFVPKPIRVFSGFSGNKIMDIALSSSLNHEEVKVERTTSYSNSHYEEENHEKMAHYSVWEEYGLGDLNYGFDQSCSQGDDQVFIDWSHLLFEESNPSINNMIDKVYDEFLRLL